MEPTTLPVRVPAAVHRELKVHAAKTGTNMTAATVEALELWAAKQKAVELRDACQGYYRKTEGTAS